MEHNVRYAMPWLMLSILMVVFVIHKLGVLRRVFVIGLMGVIWWQFLTLVVSQRIGEQAFLEFRFVYEYPWLFVLLFLSVIISFLAFEAWQKKLWWRPLVYALLLALSFSFLQQSVLARSELRSDSWQYKYSFDLMKAYEWLDNNVGDEEAIANSLNPLYYPLYGESLMRPVRYVNINPCSQCDYYSYELRGLSVRDNADYEAWRKNLLDFRADYLVLGYSVYEGLEEVRPYELEWVKEHPEDFDLVFEEGEVFVYKLVRSE